MKPQIVKTARDAKTQIMKITTTVYEVDDVILDLAVYNQEFRDTRRCVGGYQGAKCLVCDRHFKDGESIGLALIKTGNRTVCQECARTLRAQLDGRV